MPFRTIIFTTGEYYHIFNRGIADQPVFKNKRDYERFAITLDYYRYDNLPMRLSKLLAIEKEVRESHLSTLYSKDDKVVKVIAYCFMPNHFHLLVKQLKEGGISKYIRLSINSFAKYFNTKHKRAGSLFQDMFKAVRIENDEQLIHVSRYIHLNPLVSYLITKSQLLHYPWSSLAFYVSGNGVDSLAVPDIVLGNFKNGKDYLEFVLDQEEYAKELEKIKHLLLEKL